jgi:hypothetical protein
VETVTLDALIKNCLVSITEDSTLNILAQVNYGQGLTVKESPPPDGLPGESECPYFFAHSPFRRGGTADRYKHFGFSGSLIFYDPSEVVVPQSDLEIPSASEIIVSAGDRIVALVYANRPDNGCELSFEMDSDAISMWPLIGADFTFEFKQAWTTGQNPLE